MPNLVTSSLFDDCVRRLIDLGDKNVDCVRPRTDVTILMYFFWAQRDAFLAWPRFAASLFQTWRCCGMLPTVLVVNCLHDAIRVFASTYSNVGVQVEPTLVPGDIDSMSVDCISRLHNRFATRFVLIVQDDGFPLRCGLDEFVDRGYDFIGSPHCRALVIPDILTRVLRYSPCNGGFSLRSRRICTWAAEYWQNYSECHEFDRELSTEDMFYTKTLPRNKLLVRLLGRPAPSRIAGRFSTEGMYPFSGNEMPFGFHSRFGLEALAARFGRNVVEERFSCA